MLNARNHKIECFLGIRQRQKIIEMPAERASPAQMLRNEGGIDGIGKTQCRVVPPTVTTPDEISRKLGQVPPERRIKPILIEKTGE